jgi:alpha,alpha-trehalase
MQTPVHAEQVLLSLSYLRGQILGCFRHQLVEETAEAWRRWARRISYEGPHQDQVRRSAITLKVLDHISNGAIVAAPTSSLPESIGGARNWDYRYSWVRDAAFTVHALRRIGLGKEAWSFLAWVLDAVEAHARPRVLYDLNGRESPPEVEEPDLSGYRGSTPVRWGNAASRRYPEGWNTRAYCSKPSGAKLS